MSFSDPLTVTINAVPVILPRTNVQDDEAQYTSSDGLVSVSAKHDLVKGGRKRHLVRIDHSKVTSDPFKPAENVKVNMAYYVVFDLPPAGYSATEVLQVYRGFNTWYTATSDAVIGKLIAGES